MLVKNYYELIGSFLSLINTNSIKAADGNMIGFDRTNNGYGLYSKFMENMKSSYTSSEGGIRLGTGATPTTYNDYQMESPINSGISFSFPSSLTKINSDTGIDYLVAFGVTNATGEDMVIREVGLFGGIGYAPPYVKAFLIDRTVLETPITISPGSSETINYKFRLNF